MGSTDTTTTHIPGDRGDSAGSSPPSDGFSITPQDSGSSPPLFPLSVGVRGMLPTLPMWTPMRIAFMLALAGMVGLLVALGWFSVGALPPPPDPRDVFPTFGQVCDRDGVQVRLLSLAVRPRFDGKPRLFVRWSVKNTTADRKWFYRPWHEPLSLGDDLGNEYGTDGISVEGEVTSRNNPFGPGDRLRDAAAFDPPVKAAKTLILTIPGRLLNTGKDATGAPLPDFVFTFRPAQIDRDEAGDGR